MAAPLLVLDLDGTLVDSAPDILATLDVALTAHGYHVTVDESLRYAIGRGAKPLIAEALRRQNVMLDKPALDAIHDDFLVHYEANICRKSTLYPGADTLIERFSDEGWRLAVCTNKKEHYARLLLEALGVAGRFAAIAGGDTFATSKPDPAHLFDTIAASSGAPERSILVGDTRTDLDTARAANIGFVGVTFGYSPVPMAELQPDLLIDHYDSLLPERTAALFRKQPSVSEGARAAP